MAYDRYMAICHPLHYSTIMTQCLCASLVAVPWVLATLNPLLHTLMLTRLHFCSNTIHHFFCDINSLFPLSCSDTSLNQSIVLAAVALIFVVPSGCIMASYSLIISAVMKIPSAQGKLKAFSTCGSHLALVILFYGAITGIYMSPSSNHSPEKDSAASAVFMVVAPGLNPFIYSLRNSELKGALKKAVGQTKTFCQWFGLTERHSIRGKSSSVHHFLSGRSYKVVTKYLTKLGNDLNLLPNNRPYLFELLKVLLLWANTYRWSPWKLQ